MYLRLKRRRVADHGSDKITDLDGLAANLGKTLLERHYANFDWEHGGQRGTLKFVDSHQVEFAVCCALDGDLMSRLMIDRYTTGISQLIGQAGCASQYSTGSTWNNRTRVYTLRGQAVALQAIALSGRLSPSRDALYTGLQIVRFVQATRGVLARPARDPRPSHQTSRERIRDNAWFAIATDVFGAVFEQPELQQLARCHFAETLSCGEQDRAARALMGIFECPGGLDDTIAMATAVVHFANLRSNRSLLKRTRANVLEAAKCHRHPHGGYCQAGPRPIDSDDPIDIDATIELARLACAFPRYAADSALVEITEHAKRGLLDREIALTRDPECGILLLQMDLNSASSHMPGPRNAVQRAVA